MVARYGRREGIMHLPWSKNVTSSCYVNPNKDTLQWTIDVSSNYDVGECVSWAMEPEFFGRCRVQRMRKVQLENCLNELRRDGEVGEGVKFSLMHSWLTITRNVALQSFRFDMDIEMSGQTVGPWQQQQLIKIKWFYKNVNGIKHDIMVIPYPTS